MSEPDLFPEVARVVLPPIAKPPAWPYFVIAYWPRGGYWRIFENTWAQPDCVGINDFVAELQRRGWTRVNVLKLPEGIEK